MNRIMPLVSIMLLTFAVTAFAMTAKKGIQQDTKGTQAPDITLYGLDNKPFKISDHRGKVVILDFWATWCPPCKAEIPSFIELQKKYEKEGLIVIGAALDEPGKVADFARKFGINYPVGLAGQEQAKAYGGIRGIPTTFVIDRQGNIVRNYTGFRPKMVFENDIKELLKK